MEKKKNIAVWEQQRTGRQKRKLREALLGSDYNWDQEAGGGTDGGGGGARTPAVHPLCLYPELDATKAEVRGSGLPT